MSAVHLVHLYKHRPIWRLELVAGHQVLALDFISRLAGRKEVAAYDVTILVDDVYSIIEVVIIQSSVLPIFSLLVYPRRIEHGELLDNGRLHWGDRPYHTQCNAFWRLPLDTQKVHSHTAHKLLPRDFAAPQEDRAATSCPTINVPLYAYYRTLDYIHGLGEVWGRDEAR